MSTFLKVVVAFLILAVLVKLAPFLLGVFGVGVAAVSAVGGVVVGLLSLLFWAVAILLAVLSPIWVPALALVGLVALVKAASGPRVRT